MNKKVAIIDPIRGALKPEVENGLLKVLQINSDNRACRLLKEYIENGYTHNLAKDNNFVGLGMAKNDEGRMSYILKEKITDNLDIVNKISSRVKSKPAKLFGKIFRDGSLNAHEVEQFAHIISYASVETEFHLSFDPADIVYAYNNVNYYNNSGTLGGSCMSGSSHEQAINGFYGNNAGDNGGNVGILMSLHSKDNKKVTGRALIWKIDDETWVMDRVYVNSDYLFFKFKQFAKDHPNIKFYRTIQNAGGTLNFVDAETGDSSPRKFYIPVKNSVTGRFPFVDTFNMYNSHRGIVSNDPNFGYNRVLTSTGDGYGYAASDGRCKLTNERYSEDQLVWSADLGGAIYIRNAIWVEHLKQYVNVKTETCSVYNRPKDEIYIKSQCAEINGGKHIGKFVSVDDAVNINLKIGNVVFNIITTKEDVSTETCKELSASQIFDKIFT